MDGLTEDFSTLGTYRLVEGIGAEPEQFMKMAMDATRVFLLQAENRIGGRRSDGKSAGAEFGWEDYRIYAWAIR